MPDLEQQPNKSVFVDDSVNMGKKLTPTPAPDLNIGVDTDNKFYENIYKAAIGEALDINALNSFSQVSQSRDQIYSLIDTMAEDSTIAAALELYTEGATETNDDGQIVWCESNDADVTKEVQFLLDSMGIDKLAYSHMYSLIKYGDLYIRLYRKSDYKEDDLFKKENKNERTSLNESKEPLEEDVKIKAYPKGDHYSKYIQKEANPAVMFELTKMGKSYAYIKASTVPIYNIPVGNTVANQAFQQYRFNQNQKDIYIYEATNFAHACLDDNSNRTPEEVKLFLNKDNEEDSDSDISINYTVRRGKPLLYDIFKIWRTLKLIENSILLNRVTKSSIVRIVGVEVGDMPKEMVGPHLQGVKSLMEQKAAINEGKGMTEYTNPGPVENNIYVPTREGKGAINVQAVGGDPNVTGLADLDYFKNLFYGALGIPKQYMGDTEDGAGFNGGQSLSIISSVFAKRVKRFQNAYCQCITDIVNLMLLDLGLNSYVNKFTIRMQAPTTQEEETRTADLANQMSVARDVIDLLDVVEDPAVKLSIIKELLSNIITNPEVIQILQDYIDKLVDQNIPEEEDIPSEVSDEDENINIDLSSEPSLDRQLGLEPTTTEIETETETEESELPSPEELNIGDLTNNNNPEI